MILYKNVDIVDLESILENGVLSLKESGNDNWENGRRAGNSGEVVYLFYPLRKKQNSFVNYGAALLEIEIQDAKENDVRNSDLNLGKYKEFICDRVRPEQIKNIYIPELFENKVHLPQRIKEKINWCGLEACHFMNGRKESCTDEMLSLFANTATFNDCRADLYFRGLYENGEVMDISNVRYIFDGMPELPEEDPIKTRTVKDRYGRIVDIAENTIVKRWHSAETGETCYEANTVYDNEIDGYAEFIVKDTVLGK